jgi:hypothetical protein
VDGDRCREAEVIARLRAESRTRLDREHALRIASFLALAATFSGIALGLERGRDALEAEAVAAAAARANHETNRAELARRRTETPTRPTWLGDTTEEPSPPIDDRATIEREWKRTAFEEPRGRCGARPGPAPR